MFDFLASYALTIASFIFALYLLIMALSFKGQKKIKIVYLVCSILNLVIIAMVGVLTYFDSIMAGKEDLFKLISCLYEALFFIAFFIFFVFYKMYNKTIKQNYDTFMSSLSTTYWNVYYLVDKRERIKEISDSLLGELGLPKEKVVGKKLFDVFDSCVRFTMVNDLEVTNATLKEEYKNPEKTFEEGKEVHKELYMQNCFGQTVVLNVVEKGIYHNKKYAGRLCIGQKKTDESLVRVEKDLKETNTDMDEIQNKFIASLELTNEAVFFYDFKAKMFWGNDIWVKSLGVSTNDITEMDYKGFISYDDLEFYNKKIQDLTKDSPYYEIRYRFNVNGHYRFVFEKGKKIFTASGESIVGFVKVHNGNFFEHTGHPEIDSLLPFEQMVVDIDEMLKNKKMFELVCLSLTNLPEINKKQSRQVGNLVMTEYIKRLKENFLTESSRIYRVSGLIFYFTITDTRKMDLFRKSLTTNDSSMNLTMQFGAIKSELKVNVGVVDSFSDGETRDELIKNCNTCINAALNPNYKASYAFYKDIKNYL